ncbi:hypothetical protein H696_04199 [Fonticula alba]|uniref:Uncharacterized protein n=1 Tax=Fonticula alba TaxID=691883 RepID=A0A058Z3D8_FONAL|nr:hypothetical protein H696_04199 [Fonticula alba]KCV68780.1 hypothetical protein H696_04199 [Fonticula alba]|eukprot:XP_009496351.1 hypothetical protein H696_04199 [Fonticula alba]
MLVRAVRHFCGTHAARLAIAAGQPPAPPLPLFLPLPSITPRRLSSAAARSSAVPPLRSYPMQLCFLGTGSAIPSASRGTSAMAMVVDGTHMLLFDCGENTQVKLQQSKLGFRKMSHIFITHAHGDHVNGLVGLLMTLSSSAGSTGFVPGDGHLVIVGPPGLRAYLRQSLRFSGTNMAFRFVVHELHPALGEAPALDDSPAGDFLFNELQGRNVRPNPATAGASIDGASASAAGSPISYCTCGASPPCDALPPGDGGASSIHRECIRPAPAGTYDVPLAADWPETPGAGPDARLLCSGHFSFGPNCPSGMDDEGLRARLRADGRPDLSDADAVSWMFDPATYPVVESAPAPAPVPKSPSKAPTLLALPADATGGQGPVRASLTDRVAYRVPGLPACQLPFRVTAAPLAHDTFSFGFAVTEFPKRPRFDSAALLEAIGKRMPDIPARDISRKISSVICNGGHFVADDSSPHPGASFCAAEFIVPPVPGRRVAFMGDTSDSRAALAICHGADAIVHEATLAGFQILRDGSLDPGTEESHRAAEGLARSRGHSTPQMAGKFARLASHKSHLILSHFSARYPALNVAQPPTSSPEAPLTAPQNHMEMIVKLAADQHPGGQVSAAHDLCTFVIR